MRCDPEGVVEAAVTAYALGDYETAAAFYAPDATYALYADGDVYPFAGEWRGREAIVNCWREMAEAFDLVRFELRNIKTVNGELTCQIDYELHHLDSGEMLDGVARLILEVRDGQIVREREYNDVERLRAFMRFCEGKSRSHVEPAASRS